MTDTPAVEGTIQPKATAFELDVTVAKGDFDFQCVDYWNTIKDRLAPEIVKKALKGGYREVKRERVEKAVGKSELYRPVLIKYVSDFLDTQPRQAIAYNEISIFEGVASYIIKASVYLEPEIKWKKTPGVTEPLVIKIPKVAADLKDRVVEQELKRIQTDNAILTPEPEATEATLGSVVALDCQTLVDGQPWEAGCFKNNKWPLDESVFKIKGMITNLVGMRAGETKTFSITYPEVFGDLSGKTGELTVRVNQVYKRELPEIDDDLAISIGKNSLAELKQELDTKFAATLAKERDEVVMMNILSQLLNQEVVDVDPIPYVWLASKAQMLYEQNRNMARTEEDLIARFKGATTMDNTAVDSKATLLAYLGERAAQNLVSDLIVRSWGIHKGVEGDKRLNSMDKYVPLVQKALVETVQIEEVETGV